MTATTIGEATRNRETLTNPPLLRRFRDAAQDTATVTWRDMLRTARQPEMLTFAVIMGVFFLLLFNYVFGGAIGAGAGVDYIQYVVPGVLVITALQGAQQTGTGLASDISEGVTNRFRSLPISQGAVISGRTLADSIRNLIGLVLVAIVGLLMGFRFASLGGAIGAILLAVGVGYAFSWLGAAIGAKVRNPEMVGMLSMFWLFPLMLASSAFTPTSSMPGWLRGFANHQPISVATDAVRGLTDGSDAGGDVLYALAWIALMLIVFVPLASRLYSKP
ncbi:MAG: ABC transporter permease [Actinomycetota bacterium]|nr:ABC transporter permease [Actinomycetota bacterium]